MTIVVYCQEAHERNVSKFLRDIKAKVYDKDVPGKAYIKVREKIIPVHPSVRRENVFFYYEKPRSL